MLAPICFHSGCYPCILVLVVGLFFLFLFSQPLQQPLSSFLSASSPFPVDLALAPCGNGMLWSVRTQREVCACQWRRCSSDITHTHAHASPFPLSAARPRQLSPNLVVHVLKMTTSGSASKLDELAGRPGGWLTPR